SADGSAPGVKRGALQATTPRPLLAPPPPPPATQLVDMVFLETPRPARPPTPALPHEGGGRQDALAPRGGGFGWGVGKAKDNPVHLLHRADLTAGGGPGVGQKRRRCGSARRGRRWRWRRRRGGGARGGRPARRSARSR